MTSIWPLRFREVGEELIFTTEAGAWFRGDEEFLKRYAFDRLTERDVTFLRRQGAVFDRENDLAYSAFLRNWAGRHAGKTGGIGYAILVPTLRCNLSCTYCQVSRANENARGHDWTEETLAQVLDFLDRLDHDSPKIEFQGGEPFLRLDLLERVRAFCRGRFKNPSFVVCTNMQSVSEDAWNFLNAEDTHVSTSIDGPPDIHTAQRTFDRSATEQFLLNVEEFIERFGADRISALPTVDLTRPFDADGLIDAYAKFGIGSIYLRPINRQGFARRSPVAGNEAKAWADLHRSFVHRLIERNFEHGTTFEEFYFTHALRRVVRSGVDSHVDIRNPNLLGDGYLVIDYDGRLYPTDEARMITRVGKIDLSIGTLGTGVDTNKLHSLNAWSFNDLDPDCQHCAYQPFCGTDIVDDVSRYGRIDLPRHETWFCQRHTALYDLVFELMSDPTPAVRHSLALWTGIANWPESVVEKHS